MPAAQEKSTAKPTTAAAWKKLKRHDGVTLPSGAVVTIEIPDLPNLVAAGEVPNELVDVAIDAAQGKPVTREDIVKQADFYNRLAAWTVKDPEVTVEDFANSILPFEDKEMLVSFATRQNDMDAVGHHIAGLEKLATFRNTRGIFSYDEDLASS